MPTRNLFKQPNNLVLLNLKSKDEQMSFVTENLALPVSTDFGDDLVPLTLLAQP